MATTPVLTIGTSLADVLRANLQIEASLIRQQVSLARLIQMQRLADRGGRGTGPPGTGLPGGGRGLTAGETAAAVAGGTHLARTIAEYRKFAAKHGITAQSLQSADRMVTDPAEFDAASGMSQAEVVKYFTKRAKAASLIRKVRYRDLRPGESVAGSQMLGLPDAAGNIQYRQVVRVADIVGKVAENNPSIGRRFGRAVGRALEQHRQGIPAIESMGQASNTLRKLGRLGRAGSMFLRGGIGGLRALGALGRLAFGPVGLAVTAGLAVAEAGVAGIEAIPPGFHSFINKNLGLNIRLPGIGRIRDYARDDVRQKRDDLNAETRRRLFSLATSRQFFGDVPATKAKDILSAISKAQQYMYKQPDQRRAWYNPRRWIHWEYAPDEEEREAIQRRHLNWVRKNMESLTKDPVMASAVLNELQKTHAYAPRTLGQKLIRDWLNHKQNPNIDKVYDQAVHELEVIHERAEKQRDLDSDPVQRSWLHDQDIRASAVAEFRENLMYLQWNKF